ncbi:glucose-1-phosphate adenylyltransferase [Motilimonas eburnea]|uniref:glucose-1-phosphate adenylyltransferase n=1 Tax=Motilimonas eburnea TaxID=1737488 RepID=UPI001E2E3E58|nr:glucose-1-phosphate adenylyltransferase [Motilimonas eburnea]MCE2573826.1 glucose-1-phosphate adenylyltransferase [Motilimonas eburnea]
MFNATYAASAQLRDTVAIVLAGGKGKRLQHLTHNRAKPGIPFGGKYRIIDFTLSNCINSGIRRVDVLTQYKACDLVFHIQRAWGHMRWELGEYVGIVPAQQQKGDDWYKGTADAVFQNLDLLRRQGCKHVLILGGDHIYKMDYSLMLAEHVRRGAELTVATICADVERAKSFGVCEINESQRITAFEEKPASPSRIPGDDKHALCSMGIYIFDIDVLERMLIADAENQQSAHDFGYNIIPEAIQHHNVYTYVFNSVSDGIQHYWKDVGNLDEYYQANMDLVSVSPELNLYDERWPIYTCQEQLPGAKFVFDDDGCRGEALDSVVSAGCIISGARVKNSLLFSRVRVEKRSQIEACIVLPSVSIARDCKIRGAILAEGCQVPPGTVIGYDAEQDAKKYCVSDKGILLVTPEMLSQSATPHAAGLDSHLSKTWLNVSQFTH